MCLWLCLCTLKFLLVSRQHFETEKKGFRIFYEEKRVFSFLKKRP